MAILLRIFFLLMIFVLPVFPLEARFESGFPKLLSEKWNTRSAESFEALQEFLEREFSSISPLEWRVSKRQEDETHIHFTLDLFFESYPVFFQHLKVHWNKAGFIDYATNTLKQNISIPSRPERSSWEELKDSLIQVLYPKKRFQGSARGTLGLWLTEDQTQAFWAYDIQALPGHGRSLKRGVVSLETRKLLEEKRILRHWEERGEDRDTVTVKYFKKFPGPDLTDSSDSTPALDITESGKLKDEVSWVRYDRGHESEDPQVYEETTGATDIGGSTDDPEGYQDSCSNTQSVCSNQKLDSGNVFYHLKQYRGWLNDRAADISASLNFAYDPLPALINFMGFPIQECSKGELPINCDSDGFLKPHLHVNNAAYIGVPCADDGSMDRCLVFLRPASAKCSQISNSTKWKSLAREALVIAHEYQHYATDMISGIEFGSVGGITVADVIHEGYSDYLGASYVVQANSGDDPTGTTTTVGHYGFGACNNFKRNVATDNGSDKVFNPDFNYESPHKPGLVWASGLWELRTILNNPALVDKIALKSLYFLSTSPGFIDSIEALIQADRSLTGGLHETRIRTLFYDERKFLGSLTGAFQDADKKILKVGFQGCAHVEQAEAPSAKTSYALLVLWILGTLALPKIRRSLKEPS